MPRIRLNLAILIVLAALLAACGPDGELPPEVENTAFLIVDDVLGRALDSRQGSGGAYQHGDLEVLRWEPKALSASAEADNVTGLWCLDVGYSISATSGEGAGEPSDAQLIVLVFEQGGSDYGGGEWQPDTSTVDLGSLDEYNQYAWEDCLEH